MNESGQPWDASAPGTYSLEIVAGLTGLTCREVLWCYRAGLVGARSEGGGARLQFDDAAVYVLRRVAQVRTAYGVPLEAARLICELLDEVERLQAELDFWRHR